MTAAIALGMVLGWAVARLPRYCAALCGRTRQAIGTDAHVTIETDCECREPLEVWTPEGIFCARCRGDRTQHYLVTEPVL